MTKRYRVYPTREEQYFDRKNRKIVDDRNDRIQNAIDAHSTGYEKVMGIPLEDIYGFKKSDGVIGYVYFIQKGQEDSNKKHIKIGKAKNIKSRLSSLRTSTPDELVVIAAIPMPYGYITMAEKQLHEDFKAYHIRGEWFDLSDVDYTPTIDIMTANGQILLDADRYIRETGQQLIALARDLADKEAERAKARLEEEEAEYYAELTQKASSIYENLETLASETDSQTFWQNYHLVKSTVSDVEWTQIRHLFHKNDVYVDWLSNK